MPPVRFRGVSWHVSDHAVKRFQERVRPIGIGKARAEIRRMLPLADATPDPPRWLDREREPGTRWRTYGDVAFLIRSGNTVVTVYVRGSMSPGEARVRRKRRRRARSLQRRMPRPRSDRHLAPDLEE